MSFDEAALDKVVAVTFKVRVYSGLK